MDINALFKAQCGLYVAAVEQDGRLNGCITNTLMQQSHAPVKFAVTLDKKNLTHDMVNQKGSVALSALSVRSPVDLIRHFGFVSGREKDKFAGMPHSLDCNGNPLLEGEKVAAVFSLSVYQTVDIGTHTLFLCTADDAVDLGEEPITYAGYRESMKKK